MEERAPARFKHTAEFLTTAWKKKKARNPQFSIRAWAQSLNLSSHGALQQIISGKRPLPRHYIPRLIKSLDLERSDVLYLEALTGLDQSKSDSERSYYLKRISIISNQLEPMQSWKTFENFKRIQDPIHALIRTLTESKGFSPSPKWIQRNILFRRSLLEIKNATTRLIQFGLLGTTEGTLFKTSSHSTNTIDVPDKSVQEFHRSVLELAIQQISQQNVSQREYNSFFFNMKPGNRPKAKRRIRQFIEEFVAEFSALPGESTETMAFSLQLFDATKNNSSKGKKNEDPE